MTVFYEYIVKPHSFEEVVFRFAFAVAQGFEVCVETAFVRSDGHIVIVKQYDEVAAQCSTYIKAFQGFAAGHGAVTDDGDYIAVFPFKITCFSQT